MCQSPSLIKQSRKSQEGTDFILHQTKCLILARGVIPGRASDISMRFLSPRVSNLSCGCSCYVIPPSSRPEEATQGSLLKAAVERDGSDGRADGIFGSDESLWSFPVEENNKDSSVCGEFTCG